MHLRHLVLVGLLLSSSHLPSAPFEPAKPIKGANGIEMREFAKEPFLRNTVGVCVDDHGRVYATSVVRRKAADLDIRNFRQWIETDLSLTSIDDKRAFYHRELAPGKGRNDKIGDQNKDGSVDWKDLTVLSDRIIMVEDTDRDGVADKAITYAEGFNTEVTGIAAGVAAWDGKIYAAIEPDAWELEDTNGDGKADRRESLAHGFSVHVAYAGHNFSGPVVGPDGRVYFSSADKGMNVTNREGVNFAHPNSGTITRCELDGSNFEVFAYGLRNVQEPAFDQYGNLFGVDNDGDMKGEKERFLYITEGSDTGWRCNWQYRGKDYQIWLEEGLYVPTHPKQGAYITPCIRTYHDGPTGFAFNPGTALNNHYKDHFFMTGFPSRKLYAFQVKPKGPSFEMTGDHVVASGVLMTGLGFGPEGALYVADWSAKGYELNAKGGVWKIDDFDAAKSELREKTRILLAADWRKPKTDDLVEHLGHPDQRIRMKAQFELARRGEIALFSTITRDAQRPMLARLHALWGTRMALRKHLPFTEENFRNVVGDNFNVLLLDLESEIRAQAAKTVAEFPPLRELVTPDLIKLLADSAQRPRFFAAIALGKLKAPDAVEALVAYLAKDGSDPYHRHAGMMGLTGCATPTQLASLAGHEAKPVRLAAIVALRRLGASEVTAFLNDADPMVVAEAARAIHDDKSIPAALPALAALLEKGGSLEEATTRRALSAAIRLRNPEFAGRVASYASTASHPEEMRLQALNLLRDWCQPSKLDSVEGRYRPLAARPPHRIRPAVQSQLESLMVTTSKSIADSARKTAAVYGIGTDPGKLLDIIKKDREEAADALRLLGAGERPELATATGIALNSKHPTVRAVALEALAGLNPAQLPAAAAKALKSEALAEQRTALQLIGRSAEPAAVELLLAAVKGLASGTIAPSLSLDVVEAAATSKNTGIQSALKGYNGSKNSADPLAPFVETLAGGNPAAGKDIFNTHVAAQCVRCHQIEGAGSNVGPALGKVGAKDPRYLLESLVTPGAVVAPGYGISSFTLKNGESLTATVLKESPMGVHILDPQSQRERILKLDSIASRTPPLSSMPPMGLLLQKRELRDLLAYLQSLK